MNTPFIARVLFTLIFILVPLAARAASDGQPLSVEMEAWKVVPGEGRAEQRISATQAKGGDVIVYRATYRNQSSKTLREVVATVPVPPGMAYVADGTQPAPAEVSKDGRQFLPLSAAEKLPNVATWRAVRWSPRDLAPGTEFIVELRARVLGPSESEAK